MSLDLQLVLVELTQRYRVRAQEVAIATMTIVVYFEDAAIGALARDRIRTLATKHPSRVIVLDGTLGEHEHRIASDDWVELGVKGAGAQTLRSAVDVLRLDEAPLVLCWIAPGIAGDARFAALAAGVQTIVYNSSLVDAGHAALCELAEYVALHPSLPVADIAYLRLAAWQESVAIFFDGKDLGELFDLRRVEIACGSEPEAYYLLGWLASRLAWQPHTAASLLNGEGAPVAFEIRREGDPRRIRSIALHSSRSTYAASADDDAQTIVMSVSGSSRHPQRYRPIANPGIAALVERAILRGQNDRIFAESLAAAGRILGCAQE